jgi:hypothetical protein
MAGLPAPGAPARRPVPSNVSIGPWRPLEGHLRLSVLPARARISTAPGDPSTRYDDVWNAQIASHIRGWFTILPPGRTLARRQRQQQARVQPEGTAAPRCDHDLPVRCGLHVGDGHAAGEALLWDSQNQPPVRRAPRKMPLLRRAARTASGASGSPTIVMISPSGRLPLMSWLVQAPRAQPMR